MDAMCILDAENLTLTLDGIHGKRNNCVSILASFKHSVTFHCWILRHKAIC